MKKIILLLMLSLSIFAGERAKVTDAQKKELLSAFASYEKLHEAFFDYDNDKVLASANDLATKLEAIKHEKITHFIKDKKIPTFLRAMKKTDNRSINDSLFSNVSNHMEKIIADYEIGPDYNIYSCPMVGKRWIQNSKKMAKVHNPYAPGMPHCGSQETKY